MKGIGTITVSGVSCVLHSSSFNEANKTAIFFVTYHATHTGEVGPVEPTNKTTHSHYGYVLKGYVLKMSDNDASMSKVWNAPRAMKELGCCRLGAS